ncbi:microtubule-destabilizing protein 60-like isoform X2 [Typha latifolia]|uniref:microtubule-destabilizing protein 60-like isoform X2 n=1 Tax=Typha latifolia TaxID=4733 RepID=UPI003C308971
MLTPKKNPHPSRAPTSIICYNSENSSPNIRISPQAKESAPKTPRPPKPGKSVVNDKSSKGCRNGSDSKECEEENYEARRVSQEEFFRKDGMTRDQKENTLEVRKMRNLVMEEALSSMPEPGAGRVKHLVRAFESLLSIPGEVEAEKGEETRVMNWALPGLHQAAKESENEVNSASDVSTTEFDSRLLYISMESNDDRLSWSSGTSTGYGRSRRNDSGRSWIKKLKATNQHLFKLRTEQRGQLKEEKFTKKSEKDAYGRGKVADTYRTRSPIDNKRTGVTFSQSHMLSSIIRLPRRFVLNNKDWRKRGRQQKTQEARTVPKEPRFQTRPEKLSGVSLLGR